MVIVVHWNIRGARANAAWLQDKFFSAAHILALQETFLKPDIVFAITGKVIYREDRISAAGGGLLTAVSTMFPSSRLHLPFSSPNVECLGISIQLSRVMKLQVFNIYSPHGIVDPNWLQSLFHFATPPFLFLGDFNAHHSFWGASRDTLSGNIIADWIRDNNICILNTSIPTHFSPDRTPSLLDLSLSSPDIFGDIRISVSPDLFDSDHSPISLLLTSGRDRGIARTRYDWHSIAQNSNKIFQNATVNSYSSFNDNCVSVLNTGKRVTVVHNRFGADWWDSRLSYLLGQKRKYLRLAKRHLSPMMWTKYKKLSACLKKEIREARRIYWGKVCQNSSKSGRIYRIFKVLQDRHSPAPDSYNMINLQMAASQDFITEANAFARYYSRAPGRRIPLDFSSNIDLNIRRPFQKDELERALKNSKMKTPGKDGIPVRFLRTLNESGKEHLLQLFNKIWETGDIPSQWRESIIIPILKPGKEARNVESYRPISLTSSVGKVFERILMERLTFWILKNQPFHQSHFGFIPFRDCTVALTKLFNDLHHARNQKLYVLLVALDISGAYDSVEHDSLALKLLEAGIDGHLTKWIHDFNANRTFQVLWKGVLSDSHSLEAGVPQGCVLSPCMYSFYMRDFFEVLEPGVDAMVYADDTYVYASGPIYEDVLRKLQNTLQNAVTWGNYWNLRFNASKSAIINMSNKRFNPDDTVFIGGQPIPWVDSIKILGLTFTKNLTWNLHITELRKKTLRKLNVFKSIASPSRGIVTKDLLHIAQSAVISPLHFGSPLHSLACVTAKQKLEPVLHGALRTASGLPKWTPNPILKRITRAASIQDSHDLQRKIFIIRQLSLGNMSSLESQFAEGTSIFSDEVSEILNSLKITMTEIIKWTIPPETHNRPSVSYFYDKYPFQDKSLAPEALKQLFAQHLDTYKNWHIIATDASKSPSRTGIGIWDNTRDCGWSWELNHLNSIFTAEALALWKALQYTPSCGKLLLLSDSLSVISALAAVDHKSPKVVLFLHAAIVKASSYLEAIEVIWVPGHSGIHCNEMADDLARHLKNRAGTFKLISPEDIISCLRKQYKEKDSNDWLTSSYIADFPHLTKRSWDYRNLYLPRRGEVLLNRLQTRSLPTLAQLHRFSLVDSPLCPECQVPETTDHYLLECRKFRTERTLLYHRLNLSANIATFHSICDLAVAGKSASKYLVSFLLGTNRF